MSEDFKTPDAWEGDLYFSLNVGRYSFGRISVSNQDMSTIEDYIHLNTIKGVKFDLPSGIDVRQRIIENLTGEKSKVLAEAQVKAEEIQTRIDSLLQITYEPDPETIATE